MHMNTDKQQNTTEEQRDKERSQEPDAQKDQQPEQLKKNPNPRANGNLPDKEGIPRPAESATGSGSEITDGEDG
jgi:hypothetical protein